LARKKCSCAQKNCGIWIMDKQIVVSESSSENFNSVGARVNLSMEDADVGRFVTVLDRAAVANQLWCGEDGAVQARYDVNCTCIVW